jgi:hypothetical protein
MPIPADCLKVRALKAAPIFVPNFDPQPHSFRIANDATYAPPRKVILCNVENAVLTYTGQVTDPTTWEPNFTEALVTALMKRFARGAARRAAGEHRRPSSSPAATRRSTWPSSPRCSRAERMSYLPQDIVNQALDAIGCSDQQIGDLEEGTSAARRSRCAPMGNAASSCCARCIGTLRA